MFSQLVTALKPLLQSLTFDFRPSTLAAFICLTTLGCTTETAAPKTAGELTEAEKQQVRDLQNQRASEWGGAKKK